MTIQHLIKAEITKKNQIIEEVTRQVESLERLLNNHVCFELEGVEFASSGEIGGNEYENYQSFSKEIIKRLHVGAYRAEDITAILTQDDVYMIVLPTGEEVKLDLSKSEDEETAKTVLPLVKEFFERKGLKEKLDRNTRKKEQLISKIQKLEAKLSHPDKYTPDDLSILESRRDEAVQKLSTLQEQSIHEKEDEKRIEEINTLLSSIDHSLQK